MTGVGGRPEIVIEGSDSLDGPWKVHARSVCCVYSSNSNVKKSCSVQ